MLCKRYISPLTSIFPCAYLHAQHHLPFLEFLPFYVLYTILYENRPIENQLGEKIENTPSSTLHTLGRQRVDQRATRLVSAGFPRTRELPTAGYWTRSFHSSPEGILVNSITTLPRHR